MNRVFLALVLLTLGVMPAASATVVTTCGTLRQAYTPGATRPITVDVNGQVCA